MRYWPSGVTFSRRHAVGGFSLIELMVVITVLAMLIALLLPSLGRARNVARTAMCQGQFRQVGIAMRSYSLDHFGYLPMTAGGNPQSPGSWTGWDFALADYLDAVFTNTWNNRKTLKPHPLSFPGGIGRVGSHLDQLTVYCPGYERLFDRHGNRPSHPWSEPDVATWVAFWGVGSMRMNGWLGMYGQSTHNNRNYQLPRPRARISRLKGETLLMAEAYNHGGFGSKYSFYYNPNHGGTAPLLFIDGHVEEGLPENLPGHSCFWCINSPSEMANQDEDATDFWGWYHLKYYPSPSTFPWEDK